MAVSLGTPLGAGYASSANVSTSGPVAVGAAVPAGTMVVLDIYAGAASITFTVTDSKSNTWTLQGTASATTNASTVATYTSVITNPLTATDTITVTRSVAGGLAWYAATVTGENPNAPIDVAAVGTFSNTTTTNPAAPAVNAAAGSLVHAAFVLGNQSSVMGVPSGSEYTVSGVKLSSGSGNPRNGGVLESQRAAAGSTTPTAAITSSSTGQPLAVTYAAVSLSFAQVSTEAHSGSASFSGDGTLTATGIAGNGAAVNLAGSGTLSATGTPAAKVTATLSGSGTLTATRNLSHPTVAIIGDSLTWRSGSDANPPSRESITRSRFQAAGFDDASIYWYAVGGKPMVGTDANGKTVADNIAAAKAQLGTVDFWIIGLGTNDTGETDSAFTAGAQAILNGIGTTGKVLWVNLAYYSAANTNAAHFNPLLASVMSGATNATLLDWNTHIHAAGVYDPADWIYPTDSTHMTAQGWEKRDNFEIAATQADALGTATLSGAGTLTATGKAQTTATAPLSGTGTLTAAGAPATGATVTLTGAGNLTAAASGSGSATAAFNGTGTLTAQGTAATSITVELSGEGTLTYAAQVNAAAAADLAGNGTLTALGIIPGNERDLALTARLLGRRMTADLEPRRMTARMEAP